MRKVLWIVLLAGMAIPMLAEPASARGRRNACCCGQVYYAPPVQVYNAPACCGPSMPYAPTVQQPAVGQQPGTGQPPAGVPEPPRPTTPPIE